MFSSNILLLIFFPPCSLLFCFILVEGRLIVSCVSLSFSFPFSVLDYPHVYLSSRLPVFSLTRTGFFNQTTPGVLFVPFLASLPRWCPRLPHLEAPCPDPF